MPNDILLPRKYVDLIYSSEGKYGNWEPSVSVRLGDFGYIDRDTGSFNVQGNIFNGDFAAIHKEPLSNIGTPVIHSPDDFKVITTTGVREHGTGADLAASIPAGLFDLSLKWNFSFGRKHGAALVMIKPTITKFPWEGNIRRLLELIDKELHGKALVTSVVTCSAYGLIVGKGRSSSAVIGLSATATSPIAGIPVNVGAGADVTWLHSSTAGIWKVGSKSGCTYTPIFELSGLRKWWRKWHDDPVTQRDSGELLVSDSPFLPHLPPWGPLDDDGNEISEDEASFRCIFSYEQSNIPQEGS